MTFEEFTKSDRMLRRAWVQEPGLSIHVRKPTGHSHNADFELATISADTPGKGRLTVFLNRYSSQTSFYIENILEPRLIPYLERRGFRVVGNHVHEHDICMITAHCHHFRDELVPQISPSI